jgi:hypothetical protein
MRLVAVTGGIGKSKMQGFGYPVNHVVNHSSQGSIHTPPFSSLQGADVRGLRLLWGQLVLSHTFQDPFRGNGSGTCE